MKISDIGSALFLICLGAFMSWQAKKLTVGTPSFPGPGFFPFCLALLLIGIAMVIFFQGIKQKPAEREAGLRWQRVAVALAAIFVYAFVLESLGYLLSTFFLMILLLKLMSRKPWWYSPGVAAFISLVSYLLFRVSLQLSLPRGILGF